MLPLEKEERGKVSTGYVRLADKVNRMNRRKKVFQLHAKTPNQISIVRR